MADRSRYYLESNRVGYKLAEERMRPNPSTKIHWSNSSESRRRSVGPHREPFEVRGQYRPILELLQEDLVAEVSPHPPKELTSKVLPEPRGPQTIVI
jgi:hypothetical protein